MNRKLRRACVAIVVATGVLWVGLAVAAIWTNPGTDEVLLKILGTSVAIAFFPGMIALDGWGSVDPD